MLRMESVNRTGFRHLLLLAWFSCLLAASAQPSAAALVLDGNASSYRVADVDAVIVKDGVESGSILSSSDQLSWYPYLGHETPALNGDESLWLRFQLQPKPAALATEWLLTIPIATLQHVQVHVLSAGQPVWHSQPQGLNYGGQSRYEHGRHVAFPIPLPSDATLSVFVQIKTPTLIATPLILFQKPVFQQHRDADLLVMGVILGSLVVMLFYNLSLYLLLRDRSYLCYFIYVLFALLYLNSLTGIGHQYLWTHSEWLTQHGTLTFAAMTFLSATLFVRVFLELEKYGGILLHSNTAILVMWAVYAGCFAMTDGAALYPTVALASLGTCLVGLWVTVYLSLRKVMVAKIFTVAWIVLICGTVVFTLMLLGLLPFNGFTVYAQTFGMVAELVLLSFALAYRINLDRKHSEQAQQRALQLAIEVGDERERRLSAQKATLDLQRELTDELERQVKQRTQQYKDAMDKLELANSDLTRLTMTDPLSKVSNRRCFDKNIAVECKRAYRASQPLAVVLMDIDHFKAINDQYGHSAGDECIRRVAEELKSLVSRPGDLLARFGGEEFVYVLRNTTAQQARQVAEKGRTSVESLVVIEAGKKIPLTISMGIAARVPDSEDDYLSMIEEADMALYQAKANGRNRALLYDRMMKRPQTEFEA